MHHEAWISLAEGWVWAERSGTDPTVRNGWRPSFFCRIRPTLQLGRMRLAVRVVQHDTALHMREIDGVSGYFVRCLSVNAGDCPVLPG